MTQVSIITPWKDHPELIPDYEESVRGAQIIIVDNASSPSSAERIQELVQRQQGIYLRNDHNAGFAAANNQGMAQATGDILVFLNNDVAGGKAFLAAVASDTRPGELTGPSLQRQLVYGIWLPYLEGWCIAALRSTWDKIGGWDAEAFPQPYWEDNDLCLRAMEAGVCLRQAPWPIRHKGGQTTESLLRWGDVLEQNRATFAARVRPIFERMRRQRAESSAALERGTCTPIVDITTGGFAGMAEERLAAAKRHHQAGALRQAEQLYRQVLETEPTNGQVWYLLGAVCQGMANPQEAVVCLQQAIQWKPDHADAHNHLGVILAQLGRFDEAELSFRRALRLKPENMEVRKNLNLALRQLGKPE